MVRHTVCFKFKDKANVSRAAELLRSMKGRIPYLKAIEVGENFLDSARSYDLILITTFDSRADIDRYQEDEYHVTVIKKFMHEVVESSIAVDWEVKE